MTKNSNLNATCTSKGSKILRYLRPKKNRVGALAAHFIWPQLILMTCYKLLIAQASLVLWERGLHQSHMQLRTFLLVHYRCFHDQRVMEF